MVDILLGAGILAMLGAAVAYIVKARKRGAKCIGCPDGGTCGHGCGSCSCSGGCGGCGSETEIKG